LKEVAQSHSIDFVASDTVSTPRVHV